MIKFSLDSKYFTNISLIASFSSAYKERSFCIIVNKTFRIELPEIVAASVSTTVTQLLQTDPTATELHINIEKRSNIQKAIDKIRRTIVSRETVNVEENEISIFGEFGLRIGNDDFIHPLNEFLDESSKSLSCDNVLDVIISKLKFGNSNITTETNFISSNFETMRKLDEFILYSSNIDNIDTVESILQSDKLKLENEDSLLTFLISVCTRGNNNPGLFHLFEHVYVEYCSSECCTNFIDYVNEVVSTPGIRSLIACISRRFVKPELPVSPPFVKGRHSEILNEHCVVIGNEDPLNGIFMMEHKKGNTLIQPSSVYSSYKVDNLFDNDKETYFCSYNKDNSFIKASLKDGKTFIPNSYTIRGCNNTKDYQIQNWKLEGERSSDMKWILLDQHNNEPCERSEIRTFNISCKDKLKSVKLTQTGKRLCGDSYLVVTSFDIFGSLYE